MSDLIHQFIAHSAGRTPEATALLFKDQSLDYAELHQAVTAAANGLLALDVGAGERVAIYLPKQPETVFGIFGAAAAGACFVPVNPLLKPRQVAYILAHCNVKVLITSGQRLKLLEEVLADCPDLQTIVVVEACVSDLLKARLGLVRDAEASGLQHVDVIGSVADSNCLGNVDPKDVGHILENLGLSCAIDDGPGDFACQPAVDDLKFIGEAKVELKAVLQHLNEEIETTADESDFHA